MPHPCQRRDVGHPGLAGRRTGVLSAPLGPGALGRRHERCDRIAVACSHEAPGMGRHWSRADGGQRRGVTGVAGGAPEGRILLRLPRLDIVVGAAFAGPSVRSAPPLHCLTLRGCHARPDQPPSVGPVLLVQLCAARCAYRRRAVYRAALFSPWAGWSTGARAR